MADNEVPPTQVISDEDYMQTQNQIQLLAGVIRDLPLREFLTRFSRAEAIGPILHPTLFRDALHSGKLELVGEIARAFRQAQKQIELAEAKYLNGQTEEPHGVDG